MKNLAKSELYKISHEKKFLLLLICVAALGIITVFMNNMMSNADKIVQVTGSMAFNSSLGNTSVAIIFCAIFLGIYIGNELGSQTLQAVIARGFRRKEVFWSKTGVDLCFCAVLMVIYPLILSVGTTIANGWGKSVTGIMVGQMILKSLLYIITNLSILTVCVCLEFCINSPMGAMIINIVVIGIGVQIAVGIQDKIPWLHSILKITPIGYLKLFKKDVGAMDIVTAIAVAVLFAMAVLFFTYKIFNKRNLK